MEKKFTRKFNISSPFIVQNVEQCSHGQNKLCRQSLGGRIFDVSYMRWSHFNKICDNLRAVKNNFLKLITILK